MWPYLGLLLLVAVSGFFSAAEASVFASNRVRLRHLAHSQNNHSAQRILKLLTQPEQFVSLVLIGNTFANLLASSLMTLIALEWSSKWAFGLASLVFGLFVLLFSEILPKNIALISPEKIALKLSWPLWCSFKLLYPLVWISGKVSNLFLKKMGVSTSQNAHFFTAEELRSLIKEEKKMVSLAHRDLLLRIFELEEVRLGEILHDLEEMVALDLSDPWDEVLSDLKKMRHSRIPLIQGKRDNIVGVFHLREHWHALFDPHFTREDLIQRSQDPYFIPESARLSAQLFEFREHKQRMGFVVDEYGRILGFLTLADILDEVVGEFASNLRTLKSDWVEQEDGSWMLDGGINLRDLNRELESRELPLFSTQGPKTLSGLIIEFLEEIPPSGVCVTLEKHRMEIIQVRDNAVKTVRLFLS